MFYSFIHALDLARLCEKALKMTSIIRFTIQHKYFDNWNFGGMACFSENCGAKALYPCFLDLGNLNFKGV